MCQGLLPNCSYHECQAANSKILQDLIVVGMLPYIYVISLPTVLFVLLLLMTFM